MLNAQQILVRLGTRFWILLVLHLCGLAMPYNYNTIVYIVCYFHLELH